MIDKTQTKIIVGIAAVVWLAVALLSGSQAVPVVALKAFSIAGTVAALLLVLYDRFIWKWKVVRAFTGKPLVAGTWRGHLVSDYRSEGDSGELRRIPTAIRVKQTNSTLYVTLFTGESQSVTEQGQLIKEADDRWRMSWVYVNDPRAPVQHKSHQHRGVCDVYLSGKDGETLEGKYFTSRKTTGELALTEWSDHSYGDAASALGSTDFQANQPFVRWFK